LPPARAFQPVALEPRDEVLLGQLAQDARIAHHHAGDLAMQRMRVEAALVQLDVGQLGHGG
jgi:hypothetical protein